MNTTLLAALKEIVSQHGGLETLSDSRRVRALLSDLAANEPKPQKNALVACLECGFTALLQNAQAVERGQVKTKLAERLNREEGLDAKLCADTLDLLEAALFEEGKTEAETPGSGKRFCTACGAALPGGARFCPACGNTAAPPDQQPAQLKDQDSEVWREPRTDAENASPALKTNTELRAAARSQLRGNYLDAVKVTFVYTLLVPFLIICGPLTLGLCGYFLHRSRKENYSFGNLFEGFRFFEKSFLLGLLQSLFIFLWSLLFIVPGIVKSCSYAMSFFIMKDNPSMNVINVITESKKMMRGHRRRFFSLCFSFFGWAMLCVLSFGIGFLWLVPYMRLTFANFYVDIKQEKNNRAQ
jgi:uncharacterized membrane protein